MEKNNQNDDKRKIVNERVDLNVLAKMRPPKKNPILP